MCAGGDRFHQNFRFGPLFRESYSSPALVSTNLPRGQAPEISEAPTARSFPLPRPSSRAKSRELILSARGFLADVAVSRIPIIPYLIPSDPTSVETMGAEVDSQVAAPTGSKKLRLSTEGLTRSPCFSCGFAGRRP